MGLWFSFFGDLIPSFDVILLVILSGLRNLNSCN
jgi:hypothetical protein